LRGLRETSGGNEGKTGPRGVPTPLEVSVTRKHEQVFCWFVGAEGAKTS